MLHSLWLAATGLRRSPRRTLLTVGALANAVCGALLFYGFTRHTYWGLAEMFAQGGGGHVQLADTRWFDAPAPEDYRTELSTLEFVRSQLLTDPEIAPLVKAAGIRRQLTGMITTGISSGVFLGVGTEPELEAELAPLMVPDAGWSLADLDGEQDVVLGVVLAARLGVEPGDIVTALVTTDAGLTNAMDLEVAGVITTGSIERDRTWASMPLDTALSLVDSTQADLLVVALHDTSDTERAQAALQRMVTQHSWVQPSPWFERATYYTAVRALYDRIFGIFELLMVLVVVLSLSQAVAAVVAERRQEIALLRVVGLTRRAVVGLFVAEGLLLGLISCGVGVVLAWIVGFIVQQAGGIPMPPPPGFTEGYAAWFVFDALGYAIVLPATLLATIIASAVPAWRASRGALSRSLAGLGILLALCLSARQAMADPLADATALMAGADARRAVPADQLCQVDLVIDDVVNSVSWRLLLQGEHTLAVTTSPPPGKRQAVLRQGSQTWFQTEAMGRALRVGLGQPVQARVAMAELLAPRLLETWAPTTMHQGDGLLTVGVVAISGGPAAYASAELDFSPTGLLVQARFYGKSGALVRVVHWSWEGETMTTMEIKDPRRLQSGTQIRSSTPRCEPGAWAASQDDFLATAMELAEAG